MGEEWRLSAAPGAARGLDCKPVGAVKEREGLPMQWRPLPGAFDRVTPNLTDIGCDRAGSGPGWDGRMCRCASLRHHLRCGAGEETATDVEERWWGVVSANCPGRYCRNERIHLGLL